MQICPNQNIQHYHKCYIQNGGKFTHNVHVHIRTVNCEKKKMRIIMYLRKDMLHAVGTYKYNYAQSGYYSSPLLLI